MWILYLPSGADIVGMQGSWVTNGEVTHLLASPVQPILYVIIAKSTSFSSLAPSSEWNITLASYLLVRHMQMLNKLNTVTYMLTTY